MLYLIGGSFRVGKSELAEEVAAELAPIPIDSFEMLYPHEAIQPPAGFDRRHVIEKGLAYASLLATHLKQVHRVREHSIVDADVLLPRHIEEFRGLYNLRVVFLGLSYTTLEAIKEHEGYFNWVTTDPPETTADVAERVISNSGLIEAECAEYGQPYVDSYPGYGAGQRRALDHLLGNTMLK